eukprot:1156641-Pelagomonas_calceolata.AAC.1
MAYNKETYVNKCTVVCIVTMQQRQLGRNIARPINQGLSGERLRCIQGIRHEKAHRDGSRKTFGAETSGSQKSK